MSEGERCVVSCPVDFQHVGYFTCSHGVHVGDSVCTPGAENRAVTVCTKIAGTVEVVIDVSDGESLEAVEGYLKAGIARALGLENVHVTRIAIIEVAQGQGKRRLGSFQRKVYEVAYEILPPSGADVDLVLQKAHGLTTSGSSEWQMFRQASIERPGIVEVHQVLPKVVARKFTDEVVAEATSQQSVDAPSETGISPLTVALIFLCLLLVVGAVCTCFYVATNKQASVGVAQCEVETIPKSVVARTPSHTLLDTKGLGRIFPHAVEEWDLEQPSEPAIVAHAQSHGSPERSKVQQCWT